MTKTIPKALVEVGGVPIIDRTIHKLIEIGITEITINTHYLSKIVAEHLAMKFPKLNLRIVFEPKLLGTAGTLKHHIDWLAEDDFIVMHGDNYFQDSLQELLRNHNEANDRRVATMLTFESENPENCGVIELDNTGFILSFHEKSKTPPTNIANAAIYIFSKETKKNILSLSEDETDISIDLIPRLMREIKTVKCLGDFIDIGTLENLEKANQLENR
jgi:mannose-1-phosphate guanylyltransferase